MNLFNILAFNQAAVVNSELKAEKTDDGGLQGLSELEYHERLSHFIRGSTVNSVKGSITVVDFRPLLAVTVHDCQRKLVQEIKNVFEKDATDNQLDRIRLLSRQYTDALRDFEFVHSNRWKTSFVKDITASRIDNGPGSRLRAALIDDDGLQAHALDQSLYSDEDLLGTFDHGLLQHTATWKTRGTQREEAEDASRRREAIRFAWFKFGSAILGGLAIIVPVLVMAIPGADAKELVTASVAILIFAIAISFFSSQEPQYLVAATAAYAAVLITFVGNQNG